MDEQVHGPVDERRTSPQRIGRAGVRLALVQIAGLVTLSAVLVLVNLQLSGRVSLATLWPAALAFSMGVVVAANRSDVLVLGEEALVVESKRARKEYR